MSEKTYTITVNEETSHSVSLKDGQLTLDGKLFEADVLKISDSEFHIIRSNRSYNILITEFKRGEKKLTVKVNGTKYSTVVKDRLDDLLHAMGMDKATAQKVSEVKAPMPGLVLRVMVEGGQQIKKGDALVVLEAMKMENILKSPADAVVKKISVSKGDKVEKNQVMMVME
ncbi:MAG: biotin/lipoyl-binding protein [Bacteroidia bacterium]|nr:biotin/lipoyl-binding protein [Bacteroidia bacterium]